MAPDHAISHTLCVPYKLLFMRRSSKASFMKNIHGTFAFVSHFLRLAVLVSVWT